MNAYEYMNNKLIRVFYTTESLLKCISRNHTFIILIIHLAMILRTAKLYIFIL